MITRQPNQPLPAAGEQQRARPWLAHYDPDVPPTLRYPEQPLTWLVDEAARTHGTRDALLFYGARLTYVQFATLVDRFAASLLVRGVRPGDRVAICLPNVPQFPIAFFGALKAGAIAVPTNPIYTPSELEHQLIDSGASAIVMLAQFYHTLHAVRDRTSIRQIVLAEVPDFLPPSLAAAYRLQRLTANLPTLRLPGSRPPAHRRERPPQLAADERHPLEHDPPISRFRDLLRDSSHHGRYPLYRLPDPPRPDDVAVLQYTGGTTGLAKGAMLTHRALLANAMQTWAWAAGVQQQQQRVLCAAPFFHVYGLTVGMNLALVGGATMILVPLWAPSDAVKIIAKYRPTMFPGVPTMYLAIAREVEEHGGDIRSLAYCLSGAAPLPSEVQRRFAAQTGAHLIEGYGLTEASPVTHVNPLHGEQRAGSIGIPLPDTDAIIADPITGTPLPPGEGGELLVHGPQVMQGYWNRPEETARVLKDGWLHTGDLARMDPDGYFTIMDRLKDLIIVGGYNVYPREVEEVLYQHPGVQEAVVVGMPDEYRGETVWAYVVPKPGQSLTEAALIQFCREQLAAYKVPKHIEFRTELPKTLVGKVLRRALREEALRMGSSDQCVS
jgi:long-chain acyl-CoA synthetase